MHPEDTASKDWIQLDKLDDDLGEDPGKYLDGPLDPLPRIRGLASIEAVRAWKGAERRIAKIRNRAPRSSILDTLEDREAYLERIDEEPAVRDGREVPEKRWYHGGEPWEEVDRTVAQPRTQARQDPPLAADGGEDRGE